MTYALPRLGISGRHLPLKLQCLQSKVLRITGNLPKRTPIRDTHTVFNLPYVYDYITKLCRQQAEVMQIYENEHVRGIGQGEAGHGN
jgi:hypothetical protein